jgi:predicted metal-dependent hydrolase
MLPLRWGESERSPLSPVPIPTAAVNAATELPAAPADETATVAPAAPEIEVRVSTRRRKSATAFFENGRIVVVIPAHVRKAERQELIDWLVQRLVSRRPAAARSDEALLQRAVQLADRYVDGVRPRSIRWVQNQGKRWGSCSLQTGDIRLSHRLQEVPTWVLDATIVHELAHLLHADHSVQFHVVADRYPRQREAHVFLEGYSLGLRLGD